MSRSFLPQPNINIIAGINLTSNDIQNASAVFGITVTDALNTLNNTANTALNTANTANNTANTALNTANTANNTANTANNTANTANNTANNLSAAFPGTPVIKLSGSGATGIVDILTVPVVINTDPEFWDVYMLFENPANRSAAGFMVMKGFHSRGTGAPVAASVLQLGETIIGTPSLFLTVSGNNVILRSNWTLATNISWRVIIRRAPWNSYL